MSLWIVVTDASRGRILSFDAGSKQKWKLLKELDHPASRAKGTDLLTDAPGRQQQSFGRGARPAMEPHTDPKDVEKERFVRELAKELDRAHAHREYDRLVLVAAPQCLGMLRGAVSSVVEKSIVSTLDKDYTHLELRDLQERLLATLNGLSK